MTEPLASLLRRLETDPFFLAAVLARYAHSQGLDEAGLAETLGCRVETLTELRLCRTPRSEPLGFRQDVQAIATRFGLIPSRLAAVIRRGQALLSLGTGLPSRGRFLAAREADPPKDAPGGGS